MFEADKRCNNFKSKCLMICLNGLKCDFNDKK